MSATRRALLAAPIAVTAIPQAATAPNPDAELIRVCQEHLTNLLTYNITPNKRDDSENCPLWAAYCRTADFIAAAEPQTMAGVLAKARIATHEAMSDGDPSEFSFTCHAWAWDLLWDLLRLAGISDEALSDEWFRHLSAIQRGHA
jgi:hypothetical protein